MTATAGGQMQPVIVARRTLAGAKERNVLHLRTSTLISVPEPDEPDDSHSDRDELRWM